MSEVNSAECGDNTPMIRRRFLTPKVRRGQLATGEQVLAYVEKMNVVALFIVCVLGVVAAAVWGGSAQVYGVLCGGLLGLMLSLISFFASRHKALGRFEGAAVQVGAYLVKFALILVAFFAVQYFMSDAVSMKVAALVLLCTIITRLILSTIVIARTPVALDVQPDDECL